MIHQQQQQLGEREGVKRGKSAESKRVRGSIEQRAAGAGSCSCVASWQTVPKNGLMKMNAPLAAARLDFATYNQRSAVGVCVLCVFSVCVCVCDGVCACCLQFFMPPL